MMKTPSFEFNQSAPGQYWLLYFLGKFGYENNMLSVRLYFINTHQLSNNEKFYEREYQEEKLVSINILNYISIGAIYNRDGTCMFSEGNGLKLDLEKVTLNPGYHFSKKKLDFLGSKDFPISSTRNVDGFTYYTFNTGPKNNPTKVILPLGTLCQYLFFKSSRITIAIFRDTIEDIIFYDTKKITLKEDKLIGEIKYDNSKGWTNQEVLFLARMYFTKGEYGRIALKTLGMKIMQQHINHKNGAKPDVNSHYPEFKFPFQVPTSLNLTGKKFIENDITYFFVYAIQSMSFKEKPITVDTIELIKAYPDKQKHPDSDNLKFRNTPSALSNEDHLSITSQNDPYRQGGEVKNQPFLDNFITNLGVDVNIIQYQEPEQDEPENTIFLGSDRPYNGVTTNIEETDSESDLMAENLIKSEEMNRFSYIKEITKILGEKYNVHSSFNAFTTPLSTEYATTIECGFGKRVKIMLVTLNFKNAFFYLLELTSGETGMFHSNTFEQLPQLDLLIISKRCIKARDTMNLAQQLNSKSYWTLIREDVSFLKKRGITFLSPIRHESKNFHSSSELIEHASEKIFYTRISKLAS